MKKYRVIIRGYIGDSPRFEHIGWNKARCQENAISQAINELKTFDIKYDSLKIKVLEYKDKSELHERSS